MNAHNDHLNAVFVEAKEGEVAQYLWSDEKESKIEELLNSLNAAFDARTTLEAKMLEAFREVRPITIFSLVNACAGKPEEEWGELSSPYSYAKGMTEKLQEVLAIMTRDNDQHLQLLSRNLQEVLST